MPDHIERGTALSAYLVLVGGAHALLLLGYAISWDAKLLVPRWYVAVLMGLICVRLLSIVAIWFWSKLGVVVFAAATAVTAWLAYSIDQRGSMVGVLMLVLLLFLLKNKWQHMHWGLTRPRATLGAPDGSQGASPPI